MAENKSEYVKGYGKRPLWRWILIYLVIGTIIYGLVYYFVIARGSIPGYNTSGTSTNTPSYSYP